jgi:hypothetical protein
MASLRFIAQINLFFPADPRLVKLQPVPARHGRSGARCRGADLPVEIEDKPEAYDLHDIEGHITTTT